MIFFILNSNFEKISLIDTYESAIWTDRYLEPGDFELYFVIKDKLPSNIAMGRYLVHKDSEHTMIIEKIQVETDAEDGNKLIVSGRSLESILDRRIVWRKTIFDKNTLVQDAIAELIDDNVTNPVKDDGTLFDNRKINGFKFIRSNDDKIKNLKLEDGAEYLGDNLLDIIKKICDTNRIGFKIILDRDDANYPFKFSLYNGKDRENVVFSHKMDNLLNTNYSDDTAPYKNIARCLGPEEDVYDKVEVRGDENPHEEGWYKKVDNDWEQTEDTEVMPGVQYYSKRENDKQRMAATAFLGPRTFTGLHRREIFNDCSSASRRGEATYDKRDATGKNPHEEGWYKKVGNEYIKTADEVPLPGCEYFEKNTHTKNDEDFKKLLLQMGREKLTENKRKEEFDGEVSYDTGVFKYGKHYFIGDLVNIVNEYGFKGKTRVTEYIFSDNVSDGLVCHPTFETDEED